MLFLINESNFIKSKQETIFMTYRLKVINRSLLIITSILTIMMTIPVNAQTIVDYTMCYGYSESNLEALGATTVFLTTNKEAGIWVKITDPPESVVFKWYKPDEVYYQNTNADTIKEEATSDWGIAFSSIDIDSRTVANNPGKWKVEIFIEGELWAEQDFQIIDYEEIADDFMALAIEFDNLRNQISTVQADYDELETKYNELENDYAELEAQTGSQSDLEKIQEDYDELQEDYTQIQTNLGTTRTMMYAAVVVAVASVAIAVYFGAMKK
jgi:hypothetical protein